MQQRLSYAHMLIAWGTFSQAWADAFKGSPDLKEVERMYDELRAKGIEFPMTDLDSLAPIHTPGRVSRSACWRDR